MKTNARTLPQPAPLRHSKITLGTVPGMLLILSVMCCCGQSLREAEAMVKRGKAYLKVAQRDQYRKVNGQSYDLGPRFRWTDQALANHAVQQTSDRPLPAWQLIHGKVLQLADGGILFKEYRSEDILQEGDSELVFVKNFPKSIFVVDDSVIAFYCLPAGRHQYTSVGGATKTVVAYDYGEIPTADEIKKMRDDAQLKRDLALSQLAQAKLDSDRKQKEAREKAFAHSLSHYRARAATNEDAFVQFRLGDLLLSTGTNTPEAILWLRKAANNGNQEAEQRLKSIGK